MTSLLSTVTTLFLAAFLGHAPSTKPSVVIYEGSYPGWPWVAAGKDGTLFCVFREGTVHEFSESGKILLATSRDQGRTWCRPSVIVDAPGVDDRNVAITELRDGRLLLVYNTYTAARESTAMAAWSTNGGRTWSTPASLGIPNTRTRAAVVPLADGSLILPLYIAPGSGAIAARSTDGGRTWKAIRVPDTEGFVGDEWDLLEVSPNRLVGILRNNQAKSDGTFWKTESRDGGLTWDVPRRTNVASRRHASPPQIVRHGKAVLLLHADRRMVSVSAVRATDDEFLNWDVAHRLPCYLYNPDESPIPDGSYPVSVPVGPAKRFIVDYEIRPDSRRIAGYVVDIPGEWLGKP